MKHRQQPARRSAKNGNTREFATTAESKCFAMGIGSVIPATSRRERRTSLAIADSTCAADDAAHAGTEDHCT